MRRNACIKRCQHHRLQQDQIERAASAVLEDKGQVGASMLAIARAAKASDETPYDWHGDKTGLSSALARRNAAEVKAMLEDQIAAGGDAIETLGRVGPVLLDPVTGDRAVALIRATAADPTGGPDARRNPASKPAPPAPMPRQHAPCAARSTGSTAPFSTCWPNAPATSTVPSS